MSIGLCSHREGHVHWIFTECGPHSKSKPGVYTIRGHIAEVCVELQFFFFSVPHIPRRLKIPSPEGTRVFLWVVLMISMVMVFGDLLDIPLERLPGKLV